MFLLRWRWAFLVLGFAAVGYIGKYYTIGGIEHLHLEPRVASGPALDSGSPARSYAESTHATGGNHFDESRFPWQERLTIGEKLAVWTERQVGKVVDSVAAPASPGAVQRSPRPVPVGLPSTLPSTTAPASNPFPAPATQRAAPQLPAPSKLVRQTAESEGLVQAPTAPATESLQALPLEPLARIDDDVPITSPIPLPPGLLIPPLAQRSPPAQERAQIPTGPLQSDASAPIASAPPTGPAPLPQTTAPPAMASPDPIARAAPAAPQQAQIPSTQPPANEGVPMVAIVPPSQEFRSSASGGKAAVENLGMYWDSPQARPRNAKSIRIASFNVQSLTATKISKPQVFEILVSILRRYDVVALQEIQSARDDLLPMLIDKLNQTGRNFDYVIGPRVGRGIPHQQFAMVFDTERLETDRYALYTVEDPQDLITYEPLVAWFRCKGVPAENAFTFSLINLHIDPVSPERERELLPNLIQAIVQDGRGEDDWIIAGDLGGGSSQLAGLQQSGVRFAIQDMPTNIEGTRMLDSIFFSAVATAEYTGKSGALDFLRVYNLSMERALAISDHMPIWAEFSVLEGAEPGRVAPLSQKPVF